jgi:acarbose 7IV-phosphotransferase
MSSKIVVVGVTSLYMSVSVGEFPIPYQPTRSPDWLRVGVAGAGYHIAGTLRTLGNDVTLCTFAGRDLSGAFIRAELRGSGLLGPSVVETHASSLGVVLADRDGRRMGLPHLAMVKVVEYPAATLCRSLQGADLAVFTNIRFARPLLQHARRLGVPIAVDVHLIADVDDDYNAPWLEVADIIFCSHERLQGMTPAKWVRSIFNRYPGCAIIAIGCGSSGCILGLPDGDLVRVPAVAPRGVISTAGAGDTLFASFIHGWLATGNPVRSIERAVLYAGWAVGDSFPCAAMLTIEQLDALEAACGVRAVISRWTT